MGPSTDNTKNLVFQHKQLERWLYGILHKAWCVVVQAGFCSTEPAGAIHMEWMVFTCLRCAVCNLPKVFSLIPSKFDSFFCLNLSISFWLLLLVHVKNAKQYTIYCPSGPFQLSLPEESHCEVCLSHSVSHLFCCPICSHGRKQLHANGLGGSQAFFSGVSQLLKVSSPHLRHSAKRSHNSLVGGSRPAIYSCPVLCFIAVIRYWIEAIWEGKGLFHPTSYSSSWRLVSTGSHGRNLEVGTETEATEGHCLLAYFPWLVQLAFICKPGPPAWGWGGLDLHHPSLEMAYRHARGKIWWREFFNWGVPRLTWTSQHNFIVTLILGIKV